MVSSIIVARKNSSVRVGLTLAEPTMICVVFILLSFLLYGLRRKKSTLPGPWQPSLPFIGQSYLLIGDPLATFIRLSKRFGPMYRFDVGPLKTIILTSKSLFLEAFANKEIEGRPYNLLRSFELMMNGRGLENSLPGFAGSQGQNWKEQRMFVQQEIHYNFNQLESIVREEAEYLAQRLECAIRFDKSEVYLLNIHQFFMPATINVVWRLCTTQTFPHDHPKIIDIVNRVYEFFKFLQPGPMSFLQLQFPSLMRLARYFGIKNGLNTYKRLIEVIEQEIDNPTLDSLAHNTLVARYFEKAKDTTSCPQSFVGNLGRRNIVATLGDIFMGGADTTNNQLEWIMLFLVHNPEMQEKIRKEIHATFGTETIPDWKEQSRTPFFRAFLLEVFRLRPIAPLALPRLSMNECKINGHIIEKDTQILVDLCAILRDPTVFPNPEEFDPTRFLSNSRKEGEDTVAKIFGAGRRRCPGEKIARNEIYVITARLLQKFLFAVHDSGPVQFKGIFGLNHVPGPYSVKVSLL